MNASTSSIDIASPLTARDAERWLTLAEARRVLGTSDLRVRHLADTGRVRSFRTLGGHRRFLERDVSSVLAAGAQGEPHARASSQPWSGRLLAAVARRVVGGERGASAMDRAHQVGASVGATMRGACLPLGEATEAFVGFRRRIEQLTSQTLRGSRYSAGEVQQTMARLCELTDEILCGIAEAYERDASASSAAS